MNKLAWLVLPLALAACVVGDPAPVSPVTSTEAAMAACPVDLSEADLVDHPGCI